MTWLFALFCHTFDPREGASALTIRSTMPKGPSADVYHPPLQSSMGLRLPVHGPPILILITQRIWIYPGLRFLVLDRVTDQRRLPVDGPVPPLLLRSGAHSGKIRGNHNRQ